MCGRFTLRASTADVAKLFDAVRRADKQRPRYNIAPTQGVLCVRKQDGVRVLDTLRWGLVPSWADDPAIGNRMINARADGVATKPSFRSAFRQRRCLIPADGFYEWKAAGKRKQPYHISLTSGQPFALAGLWETWKKGNVPLESCTIITGEPNELVKEIHDRMPVILHPEDFDRWLDPREQDVAALQELLVPYPARDMQAVPVSTVVNSPANDRPECVEALDSSDSESR